MQPGDLVVSRPVESTGFYSPFFSRLSKRDDGTLAYLLGEVGDEGAVGVILCVTDVEDSYGDTLVTVLLCGCIAYAWSCHIEVAK